MFFWPFVQRNSISMNRLNRGVTLVWKTVLFLQARAFAGKRKGSLKIASINEHIKKQVTQFWCNLENNTFCFEHCFLHIT